MNAALPAVLPTATKKSIIQLVESASGRVVRTIEVNGQDPDKVENAAMRNMDCFRYFCRRVTQRLGAAVDLGAAPSAGS